MGLKPPQEHKNQKSHYEHYISPFIFIFQVVFKIFFSKNYFFKYLNVFKFEQFLIQTYLKREQFLI